MRARYNSLCANAGKQKRIGKSNFNSGSGLCLDFLVSYVKCYRQKYSLCLMIDYLGENVLHKTILLGQCFTTGELIFHLEKARQVYFHK